MGHLFRRDHGLLWVGTGRRTDQTDRGFTVKENFLDEIPPGQIINGTPITGQSWVESGFTNGLSQRQQRLFGHRAFAMSFGIGGVISGSDIVGLHVEDKIRGTPLLGECGSLKELDVSNIEKFAEHSVHGQQRCSHPGRSIQELSPGDSVASRRSFHQVCRHSLDAVLLPRLGNGEELFIRDDLRRNPSRADHAPLHDVTTTTKVGTCFMAVLSYARHADCVKYSTRCQASNGEAMALKSAVREV